MRVITRQPQMHLDDSYILTGPTAPALHRIKNRVSNLVRHCHWFYIGLTNRPWDRFCEHNRTDGIEWDRMVPLYTTSSLVKERLSEQDLIQYYCDSLQLNFTTLNRLVSKHL